MIHNFFFSIYFYAKIKKQNYWEVGMKKLILFVHGLGGGDETWGDFKAFINNDNVFNDFDVKFYEYRSSLLRIKNMLSLFSKLLSLITPQQRLPKIQDVADMLKTEIEERYGAYDEIYLITHSMGGLVARKYLYDMIKSDVPLQVKKLMLYAVPNNGSDWAKFSKLYKHEQIVQLDRESDFLQHLNQEVRNINIEEYLDDVLYVVGKYDDVVNESSALGYWGNTRVKSLPNGHTDIVKPKDVDDLSYVVFKNFITKGQIQSTTKKESQIKEPSAEVKNSPFVKKVHETLLAKRLLVLFSQDFTDITQEQALIKQHMQYFFQEGFCAVSIPFSVSDEVEYFHSLAHDCGLVQGIAHVNDWRNAIKAKLESHPNQKLLLFITNIEEGNLELDRKFAQVVRSLVGEFPNFYAIFIGRQKLASLVYDKGDLSPLNTATEIFFDDAKVVFNHAEIIQEFQALKKEREIVCSYLDDNWQVSWSTWSESQLINALFWRNILVKRHGKYGWRDEVIKQVAKEVLECASTGSAT